VSYKRKLRDIIIADGEALALATQQLKLGQDDDKNMYGILENRGRRREEIKVMDAPSFKAAYWDARVFGNTFLESLKDETDAGETSEASPEKKSKAPKSKGPDLSHFISTGAVQFGVGISVAPVTTDRMTLTNKSGVEGDKDRGMAPLGFRVIRHGIYAMPFFVNPAIAVKTGMTDKDLALLQFLIPYAYSQTSSAIRPFVDVLHAWYVEHKSPLGSCPDGSIVDALTPKLIDPNKEPVDGSDYAIPTSLSAELRERVLKITDLSNPKE